MGLSQQHCVGSHTSCQFLFDHCMLGMEYLWALAATSSLLNNPSCVAHLDIEQPSVLAEMLYTLRLQKLKHSINKPAPRAKKQLTCSNVCMLCGSAEQGSLHFSWNLLMLPMQGACLIWHQRCGWFLSQRPPSPTTQHPSHWQKAAGRGPHPRCSFGL